MAEHRRSHRQGDDRRPPARRFQVAVRRGEGARRAGGLLLPRAAHPHPRVHAAVRAQRGRGHRGGREADVHLRRPGRQLGDHAARRARPRRCAPTSATPSGTGSRSPAGTTWGRCSGTSGPSAAACASSTRWARRCSALAEPSIDAELIAMLVALLTRGGGGGGATWRWPINTLGEPEERAAYREALRGYFSQHRDALDEDSRRRLETNPLRILDSKSPEVQALCAGAPLLLDTLGEAIPRSASPRCAPCWRAGRRRTRSIRAWCAGSTTTPRPSSSCGARSGNLGSQNTLCGGGRYDRLVEVAGRTGGAGARVRHGHRAGAAGAGRSGRELRADAWRCSWRPGPGGAPRSRCRWPTGCDWRGIRTEVEHRDAGLKSQLKRADKLKAAAGAADRRERAALREAGAQGPGTGQQHEVTVARHREPHPPAARLAGR